MKFSGFVPACLCILLLNIENLQAQLRTETSILKNASAQRVREDDVNFKKLLEISKEKGWQMMKINREGNVARLVGVDVLGYPLYVVVDNNIRSAATIRTNLLWPGGSTGINLSGSSANMAGRIALWDEGKVRNTHVELVGRILAKDNNSVLSLHATHVAGTLIASGVNPLAKGMAFGAAQLLSYDFDNDVAEMLAAASSNLLISNHSYSTIAGWTYNADSTRWEYNGAANTTEDYRFGYYSELSSEYDSIAYNSPNYLIVTSGGNKRAETGPAVGQPYWRYDANRRMISAGPRPAGISSNDSYEIMTDRAGAKNVLAVGSIAAIPSGFSIPSDAVLSSFSSWGPTDDGRIKPDVVANGENLLSTTSTSDNSYALLSGTSQSSPSAAGSLFLLQEYYSKMHSGAVMRSATLKGLIIHTADDAGNAGPDYQYGWGVINMERAASVITANNVGQLIQENNLVNGANYPLQVIASGKGPLTVTLSWTDPKGVVDLVNLLNNPAKKLVNDLDIRVRKGSDTYLPFILNPANPSALATKGDNITDNVEKIIIDNTVPGETYTITVTHKGTLQRGQQAYSLIVSNVNGTAYCSSAPTNTAGARIDSVALGTVGYGNAAGCTAYTNKTSSVLTVEPNQTLPFFVRVSSCDASSTAKIVKIFIDYNNDGDFADAGEAVAQSGVINGTNNFTGSIITPASLITGYSLLMRVIVEETSTANDVTFCGTYGKGETQDYSLRIAMPTNDLGIGDIIYPEASTCTNNLQYITIKISNFGNVAKTGIPVTAVVKTGTTTVATLNAICLDTVQAQSSVNYTIPTSFVAAPGTTYNVTVSTNLTSDQNSLNNAFSTNVIVNAVSAPPAATAEVCGTTSASLKTTAGSGDIVQWYATATSTTPLATGASTSTTTITGNKTYYMSLNEVPGRAGLANKAVNTTVGDYSAVTGALMNFTNSVPLTIDNARFYVGAPGRISVTLADNVTPNGAGGFGYTVTAKTTIDVYKTGTTASDTGAIFALNLPVTVVGNHALLVTFENGATLYRNNGFTTSPYPVTLPGIISFTGNNQTTPGSFYYFFYDIGVKLANCPTSRAAVVATTATAPVVTLAGNVLTSNAATGNQWYLNGAIITGATATTYTATTSGIYKSMITSASGCVLSSNDVNFSATPVVDINGTEIALIASPNPNKGQFYLQFDVKGKDDLSISLINDLGQKVYSSLYPSFTGRFAQQIKPTGKMNPGMYLLKIEHNKKVYVRKLIVQ